jgi:hypothetical protein
MRTLVRERMPDRNGCNEQINITPRIGCTRVVQPVVISFFAGRCNPSSYYRVR